MSFAQQEQVLFDLLFDKTLRDQFCRHQTRALHAYDLDASEHNDFKAIRPVALQLDATLRADLILSHLCKSFPISFSLTSSLTNGLDHLKQLIDTTTMRNKPIDRATVFGHRLREKYASPAFTSDFASSREQAMATAILEAELGMAWTGASLKQAVLEKGDVCDKAMQADTNWLDRPVKLAAYVSAVIMPQSYTQLKKKLCVIADDKLWRQLNKTPLSASMRRSVLQKEDPRLLVSRAIVSRVSKCEPAVDHKIMELSEGFAPLFQHVDGSMSVAQILAQLKQVSAEEQMLQSIQSAFLQLLKAEMFEFV